MHSGTTWEMEGISGSHAVPASRGRGSERDAVLVRRDGISVGMTTDHVLRHCLHHHRMVEQQQKQQYTHAHTHSESYLVLGEADKLLLGLHKANCRNGTRVAAKRTHGLRGHTRVPQQHPVVHTCRGCNQSEKSHISGGATVP